MSNTEDNLPKLNPTFEEEAGEEEMEEFVNQGEYDQVMDLEEGPEPENDDDDKMEEDNNGGEDRDFVDDSVQGFFDHKESIFSISINPNNPNQVCSGGGDDLGYIWDLSTGETLAKLEGHSDSVIAVNYSHDGKYLATGGMDGKIQIFDSSNGQLIKSMDGPDEVIWMQWHPKGPVILVGSNDGTIWMFKAPSGDVMNVFIGHTQPVTCGGFTNDGKKIVSGSEDGQLIVWDPTTAQALFRVTSDDARFHQDIITSIAVHPDSQLILTGSLDHSAKLIRVSNGEILGSFQNHSDSVESVGFSKSLQLCATGSVDGTVNVWDITTMRLRHTFKHDDSVVKVQWHPTQPQLITSSVDQTVRVWDARTGELLNKFQGHSDTVLTFAIDNNGQNLVTGSDDGTSLVFNL